MRPCDARVIRRFGSPFLLSVAAAVMLSACSSTAERFADNPSDADPVYTASVPKEQVADPAQDESVESKPLASARVEPRPSSHASNATNYRETYKQPSYRTGAAPTVAASESRAPEPEIAQEPEAEAPAAAKPAAVAAKGGTVQVGPGMTLYSIARANGVSVAEIAAANDIPSPYSVRMGQTLRIPGVAQARAPQMAEAPAPRAVEAAEPIEAAKPIASKASHTVKGGETLYSLGRSYGVHPYAIADLNGLKHDSALRLGQSLRIPANGTVAAAKPVAPEKSIAKSPAPKEKAVAIAAVKKPETAAQKPAEPKAEALPPQQVAEAAPVPLADPGLPSFRWPVKGKIISAYGTKPGGLRNEGINIAVPEGSSVRSAESGVIAYAGNELKGYGNLVLIRHADGWVTAYAHNKELFVKRGDAVKRGDVIAKAGQTGSVTSPQVHFEVRKGATAMDPIRFLGSSTASN